MAAAPLILHGMGSPNVTKVILMLEECALDYRLNHVGVFKQEQFTPAFLKRNPLGKVPVLEDPQLGAPLAESGAILFWLAEREGCFLPTQNPERQDVMQWLMVQMSSIGPLMGQMNHFQLVPPGSQPYALARYGAQSEKLFRLLEERLETREWIAGGDYSIADMAVHPWSYYLERHGFDSTAHPALIRWRDRIAARPAMQRARARANEAFTAASDVTRKTATGEDLDKFFGRTDKVPATDYSAVVKM